MDFENNKTKLSEITRRYLNGQLSEAEKQEFELLLMDNPEYLEQVQLDTLLSKYLPVVKAESRWHSTKHWIKEKLSWGGGGLLAGIGCTLLFLQFATPSLEPETRSVTGIDIVYMDTLRSEAESLELVFDTSTQNKLLVIDAGISGIDKQKYIVTLIDSLNKKSVLSVSGVRLNYNGEITLLLDKSLVSSGNYRLEIVSEHNQELIREQKLRIRVKENNNR